MAKRHPSLISLSHDHHHGLALALRLRQGDNALLNDGWVHDRKDQARRVLKFYDEELSDHFRLEEEILFPAMMKHVAHTSLLITALISQHRDMERLIGRLQGSEPVSLDQTLIELGESLERHIRIEERDLFPAYKREMPQQIADTIMKSLERTVRRVDTKKRTILVSEDETEIRELLSMLFKAEGYDVLQAADGQVALDLVREHKNSIVLLVTDLGLPKLGGLELIKEARKTIPSLKVIAASGFGHANVRSEVRDVGVEEFFPKPFSPLELLETAKRLLTEQ